MTTRTRRVQKWKRFEELVAVLERLLIGVNATVKANDHIIDRYGTMRQIDVSVRIDTGTTQILMIFECRERNEANDITWVEQVYTKKDNVRADRAILVSNKPLTFKAREMARDKGIEIRSIKEIDRSLLPVTFPNRMEFKSVAWHMEGIEVFPIHKPETDEWYHDIQVALQTNDRNVFLEFANGVTMSFRDVCQKAIAELGDPRLPPDVARHEQKVELLPRNTTAKVKYGKYVIDIHRAAVLAVAIAETVEPTHSFIGDYTSDTKQVDHFVAQTGIENNGNPITFTVVGKRDENRVLVNIPYNFMNEDIRQGIDPNLGVTAEFALDETGKPKMTRVV